MRLPSESCLCKTFRPKVQNIQKKISDIRFTNQMLTENFLNFNVFSSIQIIPCTLIIDAFTVSAITPYSKTKFFEKAKSNCFLYLIAPHDPNLNIFPIYLSEAENGNATTYTQDCINDILNAPKNSKFLIKYCSVDGDPGYSNRFKEHFSKIFDSIQNFKDYLIRIREFYNFCEETIHVICDGYKSHISDEVIEFAHLNNIQLYFIPHGFTDKLQPLDVKIFGILKSTARRLFMDRYKQNPYQKRSKLDAC